jgi:hypothetical protein
MQNFIKSLNQETLSFSNVKTNSPEKIVEENGIDQNKKKRNMELPIDNYSIIDLSPPLLCSEVDATKKYHVRITWTENGRIGLRTKVIRFSPKNAKDYIDHGSECERQATNKRAEKNNDSP